MAPVRRASADISAKIVDPKPCRRDVRKGTSAIGSRLPATSAARWARVGQAVSRMSEPVAVGLIGAGPWASMVHAPVLANSPHTRLAGVWARRPEAAAELAAKNKTVAFDSVDALLDACEAVACAVPPDVQ